MQRFYSVKEDVAEMGNYLNPGNGGFQEIRNGLYVDKTGLIGMINETIGTKQKLTCISRPRRFGKSFAAKMLCAYYDKTVDSSELFDDLAIAKDETYRKYMNQYDVIYLDMISIIGAADIKDVVPYIVQNVTGEFYNSEQALRSVVKRFMRKQNKMSGYAGAFHLCRKFMPESRQRTFKLRWYVI